jgi:hypothetical protein
MNGPNKLDHYITLGWKGDKHSSLNGPIACYKENEKLLIQLHELYSQPFIFFITREWAQQARVLHNTRVGRLAMEKQSSLYGPIASYEENEVI